MPVLVGTSGWQYRDWRGVLYPPGLAQRSWLEYYASQYATVENNGSFYRLPSIQTFASWRARTAAFSSRSSSTRRNSRRTRTSKPIREHLRPIAQRWRR